MLKNLPRDLFRNLTTAQGTRAVLEREELVTAVPDQRAHQIQMQRGRFGEDAKDGPPKVSYPFRRTLIAGAFGFFALWILSLGVIIVPAGYVGVAVSRRLSVPEQQVSEAVLRGGRRARR